MKTVLLHNKYDPEGGTVILNIDHITTIQPMNTNDPQEGTYISMISGLYTIQESYQDVLSLIAMSTMNYVNDQ